MKIITSNLFLFTKPLFPQPFTLSLLLCLSLTETPSSAPLSSYVSSKSMQKPFTVEGAWRESERWKEKEKHCTCQAKSLFPLWDLCQIYRYSLISLALSFLKITLIKKIVKVKIKVVVQFLSLPRLDKVKQTSWQQGRIYKARVLHRKSIRNSRILTRNSAYSIIPEYYYSCSLFLKILTMPQFKNHEKPLSTYVQSMIWPWRELSLSLFNPSK